MNFSDIHEWYTRKRIPSIDAQQAQALYFQVHPRTAFVKNLPREAALVDIGAGDGSLTAFRRWPKPVRADLRMYGYALEKGRLFDEFDGYEIGDWNRAPPDFGGLQFDAILSAHFIEHIAEPRSFVRWTASKLRPRGRVYLEWPSENALSLPGRAALAQAGVDLMIARFDDDLTHQRLPSRGEMLAEMHAAGLQIEMSGIIRLPWFEEELMAHFRDSQDRFPVQAAFWSWSGWSQFIIAAKN